MKKIKKFYSKYKILIIITSIIILLLGIIAGIYFYNKKIEKLSTELEKTKSQAVLEKKLAEELLAEETIKMKDAQEQANQETIKKNEAAKKLAEQQMKENELNADKDNDGLTYRQEISYGTLDSNTDSDNDGILDGQDMHPAGGGRNLAQNFQWVYEKTNWEYTLSIPEDWYEYYKNKSRSPHGVVYVTFDDPYIKQIAEKIKTTAKSNGYHETSFLLSFVQSLPYVTDSYTKFDEYPKYPIETIIDRNGDCEDTAYLLTALTKAMNLGAALIQFSNHMGVGVKTVHSQSGYYYSIGEDWYYYYETTGDGFDIGDLPNDYIYEQAKVMVIGQEGSQFIYPQYIKPCFASSVISGYYSDGKDFYSDSQCKNLTYCMYDDGYYVNSQITNLYWDSNCSQVVTKGCSRAADFPGYFCTGTTYCLEYYSDSRCTQKARLCRLYTSDKYYDGYDKYWDSGCAQKVLSWCSKALYHPGYFFSSIDYEYYYDYQCTQKAEI